MNLMVGSSSEKGMYYMLYENLKNIENLLEGNEYSDGGVSYYIGVDKIDKNVSVEVSIKKILLDMGVIFSLEEDIVVTPIICPKNEMRSLCEKWHLDEQIYNQMLDTVDDFTKMYKFCDDFEYISKGNVGEIFRIIENGQERVLIDFYMVD